MVTCTFSKGTRTQLSEFVIAGALVRKEEDLLRICSVDSESRPDNTLDRVRSHEREW